MIDDMKISANSTVIVNFCSLHHGPAQFSELEVFKPLRFESKTAPASVYAKARDHEKRDHFAYGTGRRICPGIHLAERGLVANIVRGFRVGPDGRVSGRHPIDCYPATGIRMGFSTTVAAPSRLMLHGGLRRIGRLSSLRLRRPNKRFLGLICREVVNGVSVHDTQPRSCQCHNAIKRGNCEWSSVLFEYILVSQVAYQSRQYDLAVLLCIPS